VIRFAALLAAALAAAAAQAEEIAPTAARSVTLGPVSGVVYYTVERDGDRVVATLSADAQTPVRFVATLADGQSLLLSVPGAVGQKATEVTFVRHGDKVFCIDDATRGWLAERN